MVSLPKDVRRNPYCVFIFVILCGNRKKKFHVLLVLQAGEKQLERTVFQMEVM